MSSGGQGERRTPSAGWRLAGQVLRQSGRGFFRDNGPNWAAAIAYYSLLSLFPLLLGLGSVAALFGDGAWAVHRATLYLGDLLPRGSTTIQRIVKQTTAEGRGPGWLVLLPMLWTASLVFNAVTRALNVATEETERYPFWRRFWLRFLMMLALGAMFLAALASSAVLRFLHDSLGFLPQHDLVFGLIVTALPATFMLIAFYLSYRYIPQRQPGTRAALIGAGTATLMFAVAKPVFIRYVQMTGRYDAIYGSLAGTVMIIFWIWIVSMIGLFGGQVARHTEALLQEKAGRGEAAKLG